MRSALTIALFTLGCESNSKTATSAPSQNDTGSASTVDSGQEEEEEEQEEEEPPPDSGQSDTGLPEEEPDTLDLHLSVDPECVVCVIAYTTQDMAAELVLTVGESGTSLAPRVQWHADTIDTTPILELHTETTYDVQVHRVDDPSIQSEVMSITTGSLPDDFPPIVTTHADPDRMQPGLTLINIVEWQRHYSMDRNFLIVLDAEGRVVWYYRLRALNLGLQFDDKKTIYTTNSLVRGLAINPYHQTTRAWEAEDLGVDTIHHDIQPTDDGGMAFLSTEHESVPGWFDETTGWEITYDIIGDVLTTIDASGHQTWSWSILDHIDPLEHHTFDLHMTFWNRPPYEDLSFPKDWSHANGMVPHESGWLASFRNLDWLMQINPDTDAIEWIFGPGGDFELEEGSRWFSRQHSPAITEDGRILLYDNGNDRADRKPGEQPFSRVVEYELDHETGTAKEVWTWDGGIPKVYCPIVGDVDRLENGNHLITDGAVYSGTIHESGGPRPHFSGRIREVAGTETPEVIWEVILGNPDDIELEGWFVYRSIRIDSLYPTDVQPL